MEISGASRALQGFAGIRNDSPRPAETPAPAERPREAAAPRAESRPAAEAAPPERREIPADTPRENIPRGSVVDIRA